MSWTAPLASGAALPAPSRPFQPPPCGQSGQRKSLDAAAAAPRRPPQPCPGPALLGEEARVPMGRGHSGRWPGSARSAQQWLPGGSSKQMAGRAEPTILLIP